ncbi:hypothetical protein HRbin17_00438 [bacterium HR17]|uniref:ATP synthase protein I n=1 Tax=Candidatus Fervidibacter japonicus TaxID=2035412 RepID=A0A2H5X9T3_9BACT|nr:hypothetical protein HRbin17_00438 [bacterium HR17]
MGRPDPQNPRHRMDWMVAMTAGSFMVGAVLFGWLVGAWLDKRFGVDPIGKAVGVIVGGTAGTVELVRMLLRVSK